MSAKRIGLFGGTFDPIHYAHIDLAVSAAKEQHLDKVILVPAYVQPFKQDRYISSEEDRLSMLRIVSEFEGNGILDVSEYEIEKGGISYTYETVVHFQRENPKNKIYFIMGSDSFSKIETWHKGEKLLSICNFIIGTRPGDSMKVLSINADKYKKKYGNEIAILNKTMLPISSTLIREKIELGEPISGLVTPEVENYIYEKKLYI